MAAYSEEFSGDSEQARRAMRQMFGPHQIDQLIRQAISVCWMALPDDKRHVAAVEAEIRRLVERALDDLREDAQAFGIGN
jgi:hypothetical protein